MTEEYFLVTERGSDNFTDSVNEKAEEGFSVEGNLVVTPYEVGGQDGSKKPAFLFSQMMVKYTGDQESHF